MPTWTTADSAIKAVASPVAPSSAPPATDATGMATNDIIRLIATTRPSTARGTVRCRSVNQVTTITIVKTPTAPHAIAIAAALRAGIKSAVAAPAPSIEKMISAPAWRRRPRDGASRAPITAPTPWAPNTTPTSEIGRCR